MIAITLDTDWAPDSILQETLIWLMDHNIKLTVFATHDTQVLRGLAPDRVEIGIHPNLEPVALSNVEEVERVLSELKNAYPQAMGVRTHSLVNSTRLMDTFARLGFLYDASVFLPYQPGIRAFRLWNGLVRIPHFWEDDLHCAYGMPFDPMTLPLAQSGLKVFDFHPVHLFLNTDTLDRYHAAKHYYRQPDELLKFRNSTQGVKTFAQNLLEYVLERKLQTYTMRELADNASDSPVSLAGC